jgi:hypothetical protein
MIFFFVKKYANFIAWLDATKYYVTHDKKGYHFISLKKQKLYNKNRIKISMLEKFSIYSTKDWSK